VFHEAVERLRLAGDQSPRQFNFGSSFQWPVPLVIVAGRAL
jgi:hypothetical protein